MSIFNKTKFDVVLETQKNVDQMDSILKNNGYILFIIYISIKSFN